MGSYDDSRGCHTVSPARLQELGADRARQFVYDMFTCGGRIGYHEYDRWITWIEANLTE